MGDTYARLLEAVVETGDEEAADLAVKKLLLHLKSIGRIKMLSQILRELRVIAARRRALRVRVEVASKGEESAALKAAAEQGIHASKATVNPDLIRGWRARAGGKLIDRSAKNTFIQMYQKVTN